MTNLCAQTAENYDGKPVTVVIELPTGSTEKIAVDDGNATVRDLKLGCELKFGIPCNLQHVSALDNPSIELNDWSPLREAVQTINDVVVIQVPVWWNKFICVSLNNEIDNVCRRAKLPMQQITKEERLFVGYFIACCRGHENALERLKALDIQIDQHAVTEAGRNLFHAAAASGKESCVEFVAKHLIKPSKEILSGLDTNRKTPVDIARRLNHHETERLLYKYMYHDKGERDERSSAESGIGDCDSVYSDDSAEDRKSENEKTAPENTRKVCEHKREGKNTVFEKLVISECDEGLSFAIDVKLGQQETPPKEQKSEVNVIKQGVSMAVNKGHRQERETSPCSSDSSDESSSISPRLARPQTLNLAPNQHLLRRRVVRPNSALTVRYPQMNTFHQEDEQFDENDNHLPPLERQTLVKQTGGSVPSSAPSNGQVTRLKQAVTRTSSNPNSPGPMNRLSPSPDDERLVTKSAPGSPRSSRLVYKPSARPPTLGSTVCPLSPKVSSTVWDQRRGSEPVTSLRRTDGLRMGPRSRRDALLTGDLQHGDSQIGSPITHKRGKARSICEVNFLEPFRCNKDMDEEERLDRPWNAWIAVRKESMQIANPENNSPVPLNPRRKSYQQWLSEKELNHLQRLFANAQEEAKTNEKQAKLLKGKTFDEWLEDKRREMEREKEREKCVEESQKLEENKKHQRRRMSQAKYDKWLMQKESNALQMEEKMEQEAKQKYEIMKKKWEEEDEQKKKGNPLLLGRTHSLPAEGAPRVNINRNRFTSLK